jgi:acyl carrier protein
MKKKEFIKELSDYCEFENKGFTLDTKFKSIEGYDSLSIMSIIAFVDEKFGKRITAIQLREMKDFGTLIKLIGVENFEND